MLIFRNFGLYTKCLADVIYKDIPRFLVVFCIILVTFSASFYMALRAEKRDMLTERILGNK